MISCQTYLFYSMLPCSTRFGCDCYKASYNIQELLEKPLYQNPASCDIRKTDEATQIFQTTNRDYHNLREKNKKIEEEIESYRNP